MSYASTGMAAAIGFALTTGAWTISDVALPRMIDGTGEVSGPVVAGQQANIKWHVDKRTPCDGTISRVWTGENGFSLTEPYRDSMLPEGRGVYIIPAMVPELAPPGSLSLSLMVRYDCPRQLSRRFALGPVEMTVEDLE